MERYLDNYTNFANNLSEEHQANLAASFNYCKSLVRASGTNFYLGMLITPKQKRAGVYAIYAWMREIDDIADSNQPAKVRQKKLIQYYQTTLHCFKSQENNHFVGSKHWPAFKATIQKFKIPLKYFRDMVLGQLQVVHKRSVKNLDDLYQYCYQVAGTVGLILVHVWGFKGGETTCKLAEYRGIAFQLTNILRDIMADHLHGVHFIPQSLMPAESWQTLNKNKEKLNTAISILINRAQEYFRYSSQLEQMVHPDGYLSLRIMSEFYFGLLKKIRKNPELIFQKSKIKLGFFKKIFFILKCFLISKTAKDYYRYE